MLDMSQCHSIILCYIILVFCMMGRWPVVLNKHCHCHCHIGNVFSNSVEVGAQEAVYLALQIPLTKGTREVVYINTCASREIFFSIKT